MDQRKPHDAARATGARNRAAALLYEGPRGWLWIISVSRLGVLLIAGAGAFQLNVYHDMAYVLAGLYVAAFAISLLYVFSARQGKRVRPLLTWNQVLVDLGLVAATVAFTGGINSYFDFLFVVVILEAGLLLGLPQGFIFASMATAFVCLQAATPPVTPHGAAAWFEIWYRFLIQALAFYLTAFVSGYWNQRVNRMAQFQRRILDNMNSGFLIADVNGLLTIINEAGREILELADDDVVGKPVQQVLKPAYGGECPLVTALRSGRNFISYEFQAVAGPGTVKLLGVTTSHVFEGDRVSGVIASFTDLTEIAAMRQEMQRQDRLAAVGELAAGLAHEVRNPLAAIRGAMEELPKSLQSPQVALKLAAIAVRESDQLNETVTGFLDFAQNPAMHRELFDLREIAAEVKQLVQESFGEKAPPVIAVLPDVACMISGNRAQIKRVFTNIAENAQQAMDGPQTENGRTLTITIEPHPSHFDVRFDDGGPGLAPDKVAKIFEPFYTEKPKGVGMGLAICMRIITAHDGSIWAASREGGGATFTVRLPAATEKESPK
jgi:two-component system sensor histidine kinase PilS (NtrC family)